MGSSNQYKSLTSSSEGKNVVPLLQPSSHFFLQDGDFSQTDAQSFGAKSESQFQTSSTISFTGIKNVFALCHGTIFIQPQIGHQNKINLIIKPFKQPITDIPIKFIIYRGLNKNDFITSDGKVAGSESNGSEFVKYIWSDFNKFYNVDDGSTSPDFQAHFLGYPYTTQQADNQQANDLINNYFYKIAVVNENTGEESEVQAYELPTVPRGVQLGTATDSLSIDIVLDQGDYYLENDDNPFQLNLEYARASSHTLDISSINDEFLKKRCKENVIQFMDVAAFYGLHANGAGKLYLWGNNEPLTSKSDIYNLMNGFFSKNKTYLYIQANRQRSYNFYDNYNVSETDNNHFKIGDDENTLNEIDFGKFKWPIHEVSTIASNSPDESSFSFQVTTDNNPTAVLYIKNGIVASDHENNFIRKDNLLQDFVDTSGNVIGEVYVKPITIHLPSISTNVIASYVKVLCETKEIFLNEYIDPNSPNTVPLQTYTLKDVDDIFGLIKAKSFLQTKSEVEEMNSVLEEKIQLINFLKNPSSYDVGVIKIKKIKDKIEISENDFQYRLTYETLLNSIKNEVDVYTRSHSSNLDSNTSDTLTFSPQRNNFYQPKNPYYFKKILFTESEQTITGVELKTYDGSRPSKKILGITQSENDQLESLVIDHNLTQPKLFFKNLTEDYFVSSENIRYKVFLLGVVGEDIDGKIYLYFPPMEIKVYSIDEFLYTSNVYAKYVPVLNFSTDINDLKPDFNG